MSSVAWYRYDAGRQCLILTLHVQPNARSSGFAGLHGDAVKVRIAAPATDNKANLELMRFLSETCRLPRSSIAIRHGSTGRRKVVEIAAGHDLIARIERLI